MNNTDPSPATVFTVCVPRSIQNELDLVLSPIETILAIDQVHEQLPALHRPAPRQPGSQKAGGWSRLHHGRFGWLDIGFTYAQLGSRLVIVNLWPDRLWGSPDRSKAGGVVIRDDSAERYGR
jgi:hypothetical protein